MAPPTEVTDFPEDIQKRLVSLHCSQGSGIRKAGIYCTSPVKAWKATAPEGSGIENVGSP